ncbi:Cupredoxin, partial [Rhizophagus irregularis]
SFIYNFTTGDQHGTFWYHSHFMAQYADGLRGALIVHVPDDPYLKEYDYEYVITLSDWHHRRPIPDSPLLSGRSRYNCNGAPDGSKCKPNAPLAVYNVKKNKKYRFRIINTAADAFFIFSIDEYKLKLIESEGIYIKPTIIEKLPI